MDKALISPTPGLNLERVFIRQFDDKILLIDQMLGRWVILDDIYLPIVMALRLEKEELGVNKQVAELSQLLIHHGIGVTDRPDPTGLNTLILKLTKKCNIACTYCYDFEHGDTAQHGDLGQLKDAISQAVELLDATTPLYVIFHGGEPMLVWDMLTELVLFGESEAKRQGRSIRFQGQTNLTALTQRKIRFSEDHDIAWGISLDGDASINDQYRQRIDGKGSYYLFERNYKRHGAFVRSFPVLSTITAANCSQLLDIASHFRDLGMAGWDWSLFQPIGRARDKISHMSIDKDALLASWSELFQAVENGRFDGFPVQPVLKYLKNFIEGPGANMCLRPRCGAARDLLSVSYDGAIEACDCLDRTGELSPLGYISDMGLDAARKSETAQKIRKRDTVLGHCQNCLWFGVCGGTCLAHAGGLQSVDELHCSLSQLAFDSIARSLSKSHRLFDYLRSCTNDPGRI